MTPLIGGPYSAPQCKRDDWLVDKIDGLVQVGAISDAPIPWPLRKKGGRPSLILTGDLIRAVRVESERAIAEHFGVGTVTVWKWRKALVVNRVTDGTRELLRERTGVPSDASQRGRDQASTPESRARAAEKRRGRPAHPNTAAELKKGREAPKPDGWGDRANEWMNAGKARRDQSRGGD